MDLLKIVENQDKLFALEYSKKRNTYAVSSLYESLKSNFIRHIRGEQDDWVILQIGVDKAPLLRLSETAKNGREKNIEGSGNSTED